MARYSWVYLQAPYCWLVGGWRKIFSRFVLVVSPDRRFTASRHALFRAILEISGFEFVPQMQKFTVTTLALPLQHTDETSFQAIYLALIFKLV